MCPIWGYSGNAASLLSNTMRCPLLAQSGHPTAPYQCPLSGGNVLQNSPVDLCGGER